MVFSVHDNSTTKNEDDEFESTYLKIQTDHAGKLVKHNQLTDYWFRGESLSHMHFYDFVCCVKLQKKKEKDDCMATNGTEHLNSQIKHTFFVIIR
jgi:hypothetical protein